MRLSRRMNPAQRVLLALIPFALLWGGPGCHRSESAGSPNIVLIVIDTLRADHVGIYGHERETTPNLDRLAHRGAFFRRAYAQSSWTLPSIASLLTGLLPHRHGVGRDAKDSRRFGRLAPEIPTLPEMLRDAGYATGAVVNNVFLAPEFGLQRGFGEDYDYQGATKWSIRSAESSVDVALSWIRQTDRPYFLLLHFMEPHLFYDPAPGARGMFTGDGEPPIPVPFGTDESVEELRRRKPSLDAKQLEYLEALYDEEIFAVDLALGRLVEEMKKEEGWEETILIVTSDHGEEFFDHGGFEHGHTLYGELTRVPLIVHGPGLGLGEIEGVVEHIDVSRGILALAGLSVPGQASGEDLFSRIKRGGKPSRGSSVAENPLYGPPRIAYTSDGYRLHYMPGRKSFEVWELDSNGLETRRLRSPESGEQARRLKAELRARRGSLAAMRIAEGPRLSDSELSQLMALGYIERDPAKD